MFNQALLAKIAWRIITVPDSFLARILIGKYCHKKNFLEVDLPKVCSHGWRGILQGRNLLREKLGKAIGNGMTTRVWRDSWMSLDEQLKFCGPEFKEKILRLHPSQAGAEDCFIWHPLPSGILFSKDENVSMVSAPRCSPSRRKPLKEAVHIAATDNFSTAMIRFRSSVCLPPTGVTTTVFLWVCWSLWKDRNLLIFENKPSQPSMCFRTQQRSRPMRRGTPTDAGPVWHGSLGMVKGERSRKDLQYRITSHPLWQQRRLQLERDSVWPGTLRFRISGSTPIT